MSVGPDDGAATMGELRRIPLTIICKLNGATTDGVLVAVMENDLTELEDRTQRLSIIADLAADVIAAWPETSDRIDDQLRMMLFLLREYLPALHTTAAAVQREEGT